MAVSRPLLLSPRPFLEFLTVTAGFVVPRFRCVPLIVTCQRMLPTITNRRRVGIIAVQVLAGPTFVPKKDQVGQTDDVGTLELSLAAIAVAEHCCVPHDVLHNLRGQLPLWISFVANG